MRFWMSGESEAGRRQSAGRTGLEELVAAAFGPGWGCGGPGMEPAEGAAAADVRAVECRR